MTPVPTLRTCYSARRSVALMGCTVALAAIGVAGPPGSYDTIIVGDREYIRRQDRLGNFPETITVSAEFRTAAVTTVDYLDAGDYYLYVQHFDHWGRALHTPVNVEPALGWRAVGPTCVHRDGRTLVLWHPRSVNQEWIRAIGPAGTFESAALLVGTDNSLPSRWAVAARGDFVCLVSCPQSAAGNELRVRWYDFDLNPLTAWITTGTFSGSFNTSTAIDVRPDGIAILSATNQYMTDTRWRLLVQRVDSSGSFGPVQFWAEANYCCPDLVTLKQGSFALAHAEKQGAFEIPRVREIDEHGSVLRGFELATPYRDAGFSSNGNLVVAYVPTSYRTQIHLFDAEWNELGPPVDVTRPTQFQNQDFFQTRKCVAIDDDGNVWIVWNGFTPGNQRFITTLAPFLRGDMNRDGRVDNFDIDPFVYALTNPTAYAAQYNIPEDVAAILGDVNRDGAFNNFDIDPFVMLLAGE